MPSLPGPFLSRPRLLAALDRGAAATLTLVSAPAGFGKTSLLVDWLARGGAPGAVAWVTCERDAPGEVWRTLLERLGQAVPDSPLARLRPAQAGANDRVGMELAAHLRALDEPLTLVLDDFHEVHDADLIATVARLVRADPPALRLVLATRADPPLPLARLRLQGALTEIRAADLALGVGETMALFEGGAWTPPDASVRLLVDRTEGWPAGVRLVMLSLAAAPDPGEFIRTLAGDDHAIAAYLFEEVLDAQPPEVRRFLLEASILEHLDASLAERVTGLHGSARLLAHLARHNVFLETVGAHGTSFRFHRLFRELLLNEARQELSDRLPELHRRAAGWSSEHGRSLDAIRHARAGGDWALVREVLASDAMRLVLEGQAESVVDALGDGPLEHASDPELLSSAAMVAAEAGDAEYVARCVERLSAAAPDLPPARRARFELTRAIAELARLGAVSDAAAVRKACGAVLAALEDLPDAPGAAPHRVVALLRLGVAESAAVPDGPEGLRHLQAAAAGAQAVGEPYLAVRASAELALRHARDLRLEEAVAAASAALQIADPAGWASTPPSAPAHLALAIVRLETGDPAGASEALDAAAPAVARPGADRRLVALHALLSARLSGSPPAERRAAYQAIATDAAGVPALEREIAAWLAGGLEGVGDRAPSGPGAGLGLLGPRWELVRARRLLAEGVVDEAEGVLGALAGSGPADLWPYTRLDVLVLAALAADRGRHAASASGRLEEALAISEATGAVRAWAEGGRSVQTLLHGHARSATRHRRTVLDLVALPAGGGRSPAVVPLEPLTPREDSVLRYLSTELSGEDIAAELYISLNTVKTHLRSIYRKLDASSRREAVANARALGLTAPRRRV